MTIELKVPAILRGDSDPLIVWLGDVPRQAEIEATGLVKRGFPLVLRLEGDVDEVAS